MNKQQTAGEMNAGLAICFCILILAVFVVLGGCVATTPRSDIGHVLAFGRPSCYQCEVDKPKLQSLGVRVIYVDGEQDSISADHYGVTAYPTYIVFNQQGYVLFTTNYYQELRAFVRGG